MAQHYTENVKAEAEAVASVANELVSLYQRVKQMLAHNTALNVAWTSATSPVLEVTASGNLQGLGYTGTQISNALGSMTQFVNLMENQTVTEGNHLSNFNLVARPLG